MRGRFALVVWDPEAQAGAAAVDPLGVGSLFYCTLGGPVVFATELRDVLDALPRIPSPDRTAVVHWLVDGTASCGETLYEGVRRLEGGSLLELSRSGCRVRTYWRPRYRPPLAAPRAELASEVRRQVVAAVARRVDAVELPALSLSGGLDSNAVLAAAAADGQQGALHAYSAVFPDHPEVDESGLIESATVAAGVPSTVLAVRPGGMLAASLDYLRRWRLPSISPNLYFQDVLAATAAGDARDLLLDGQGGDELFGASPYLIADALRRGRIRTARALAAADDDGGWAMRRYGWKGLLPHAVHALAQVVPGRRRAPTWLLPAEARRLGRKRDAWGWKRLDGPRWWANLADTLTSQRSRIGAYDLLRRRGDAAGIPTAHPFLDDLELVELALRLPPEVHFGAPLDRPLLREALADLLPPAVAARSEKSYFDSILTSSLERDAEPIRRLLGPGAELGGYVRLDALRGALLERTRPLHGRELQLLWRLVAMECWLRSLVEPSFATTALESWGLTRADVEVRRPV